MGLAETETLVDNKITALMRYFLARLPKAATYKSGNTPKSENTRSPRFNFFNPAQKDWANFERLDL